MLLEKREGCRRVIAPDGSTSRQAGSVNVGRVATQPVPLVLQSVVGPLSPREGGLPGCSDCDSVLNIQLAIQWI
jgi:hypothetical protein